MIYYVIITRNLSKTYYNKDRTVDALATLNIEIKKGEIVALLGPNGAGKSTTIKTLATILRPTGGGATINNFDLLIDQLNIRSSIGLTTEVPGFYERISGRKNLQFFSDLYDIDKGIRDQRIENFVKKFGLDEAIEAPVGTYSKGMKQKLSVIKALLHDPALLLLDEPMDGLSPDAQNELRKLFVQLAEKEQKTFLISTHNLPEAERIVDRIFFINKGKLLEAGTPEELRTKFLIKPIVRIKFLGSFDFTNKLKDLDFVNEFTVKPSGKIVDITIDSFEHTPTLIDNLSNNKLAMHGVEEIVPSLEEIYLDLLNQEVTA